MPTFAVKNLLDPIDGLTDLDNKVYLQEMCIRDSYKLKTRLVKKVIWPLARFIILFGICFLLVYPLLFMFTSAFRSREDMWNPSVVWITRHFTLEHIKTLIDVIDYPEALKNTLLVLSLIHI